uniref:Uncharacterized protein n=1 Tax=Anguilla anguilla TaxID=7936 RepID=A0A0E9XIR8_ANGAN
MLQIDILFLSEGTVSSSQYITHHYVAAKFLATKHTFQIQQPCFNETLHWQVISILPYPSANFRPTSATTYLPPFS